MRDLEEYYEIGRQNARAKALLAAHCLNADLTVRVSPLGHSVGLPIGMAEIRCPHAPFFGHSMMDGMTLAVEFYEASCHGCPHRRPSGQLPTIASEAEARRAARRQAEDVAAQDAQAKREAWSARKAARDQATQGQAYPTRDLAAQIDLLDRDPAMEALGEDAVADARRKVVETARVEPHLFTAPLIQTLMTLARGSEGTAHTVLGALASAGVVSAADAAGIAARALAQRPLPEAGRLVAMFAHAVEPGDVALACRGAIALTAEPERVFGEQNPSEPEALLALAAVDPQTVLAATVDALRSDDDRMRELAAQAARHLLKDDPGRLAVLGVPLVRAIRGKDAGYMGSPNPASAAVGALAQAWMQDPTGTATVIEANAGALEEDGLEALATIARVVLRRAEPEPVLEDATRAAADFMMRRLDSSWGQRAALDASDDLTRVARDLPALLRPQVGALLGHLLTACEDALPTASGLQLPAPGPLERMQQDITDSGRRRLRSDLAKTLGLLARAGAGEVLPRIFALLAATTGDATADARTRSALLDVLGNAVTAENISRILPTLYTGLLSADQVVRADAIKLWATCARVVDALPANLEALVPALLADPYVIVHRAIVRELLRLKVSDKMRAAALSPVYVIARAHQGENARAVAEALRTLLWCAGAHPGDTQARVMEIVIAFSTDLDPMDREDVILAADLLPYRSSVAWAEAALAVIALLDRSPVVNRDDRLLEALLEEPSGLATIPLATFESIAIAQAPAALANARDLVELLQSAARWRDAQRLATGVLDAIPDTTENATRRAWFSIVAAAVDAEAAASEGLNPPTLPTWADGEQPPHLLAHAMARREAREAILTLADADPNAAAEIVARAAQAIEASADGRDRISLYAVSLTVAAALLRWDTAFRATGDDAAAILSGAQRQAKALERRARGELLDGDPIIAFAARASSASATDVDELLALITTIAVALPLAERRNVTRRLLNAKTEPSAVSAAIEQTRPLVVCVPRLNGHPVVDTEVLRPEAAHDLSLELRLEAWPTWAESCEIELLSALPADALVLPTFHLTRADGVQDSYGLRFSSTGKLMFRATRPLGADAVDLPIHVRFTSSNGRSETALVGGYARLRVMPFDPVRHALTDRPQLDRRLLIMYDELAEDPTLDEDDVRAFCHFFTAIVTAAQSIMFDKAFRAGTQVTETQFHDAFEALLLSDPDLDGQLTRRDAVAGGFDDLLYKGIIAELKVEKTTTRTLVDCARYIGQPTQYGVGLGSRLSILVVLDHTRKVAPPRVLENDFGWLHPAQHGLTDPRYPSRVGVLVIPTNWPVPSAWSRRRIGMR